MCLQTLLLSDKYKMYGCAFSIETGFHISMELMG